ncbi:hypothetical protein [Mucilaginibacter conchicola]|nr:hypothetical protein [Mucilaginibacter conchicola]
MMIFIPPFEKHHTSSAVAAALVILAPVIYLVRITIKYTIPAIKGKTALEINQTGIIDYARHFIIEWADITDLRLFYNRGMATIYFHFKDTEGVEDYIRTRLIWVSGDSREIYSIIAANLEDRNPNWKIKHE